MSWIYGGCSTIGASHSEHGIECQDYCYFGIASKQENVFWCVVSDGAGSSRHSAIAARETCITIGDAIVEKMSTLEDGLINFRSGAIKEWLATARERLWSICNSEEGSGNFDDYLCTVLGVVVGPNAGFWFHIGDGSIIAQVSCQESSTYEVLSWPDNGEYANSTYFLGQENYLDNLRIGSINAYTTSLCVMTDGMQNLALDLSAKTPHAPFFDPLFSHLKQYPAGRAELFELHLDKLFSGEKVNSRTGDDKTMVFAVRGASGPPKSAVDIEPDHDTE